ncbi:hypothetical protein PTKIN_Ptkin09bG0051600 [Pterospermum kingtungense]
MEYEDPDFSYSANRNQETPIYIAARRGYMSSLDLILNKFKSPVHGGPHGRTVLHAAATSGDSSKFINKKSSRSERRPGITPGQVTKAFRGSLMPENESLKVTKKMVSGYKSEDSGPDLQGTPFLIGEAAFRAFVISNALAFMLSHAAVAIHFQMAFPLLRIPRRASFAVAGSCIAYAVPAVVIAFCTGTYAVLQPSHWLAIIPCCIGVGIGLSLLTQRINPTFQFRKAILNFKRK